MRPRASSPIPYCSYDTGLDRGFTHYEDYVLEPLEAPADGHLVNIALKASPV